MNKQMKQTGATGSNTLHGTGGPHIQVAGSLGAMLVNPPASVTGKAKPSSAHLSAVKLYKNYKKGSLSIPVLQGVDLEVQYGEFVAIVGQSGSGKSTLLHLLGTLDAPTDGEVHFLDQ